MARYYILDGQIDEAVELLAPLLQRDRLYISDFRALADAEIALAKARGEEDAARSWLEMWASMEEDHPRVLRWRARLEGVDDVSQDLWNLVWRLGGGSDDD